MAKRKVKREQPRKDSNTKRVNFDNESKAKFDRDFKPTKAKTNKSSNRMNKDVDIKAEGKKKSNDASWYSKNAILLKSAGSLPFATIAGTRIEDTGASVPGIMTFSFVHNYEMGEEANAMRQAFDSQYSFIVHANSRNYVYDAIDLGVLETSGMEVFSLVASMARAYGYARYYEEENLYNGRALLTAMGFDPDDFYMNLGQIWFDLNLIIDMTRQIWIPNTMPLLARWIWMNSTVFTDGEGKRAQYYMYQQSAYYMYAHKVGTKIGSGLIQVPELDTLPEDPFRPGAHMQEFGVGNSIETGLYPWSTWKNVAMQMINRLINDQDRGIIFGDILNAYGKDKIFAFPSVPADYKLAPVYNAEVMTQFENATMVRGYCPIGYYQSKGKFLKRIMTDSSYTWPTTMDGKFATPVHPIINFHIPEQPTPEQIMVATRMTSCGSSLIDVEVARLQELVEENATADFIKKRKPVPKTTGSEICIGITTSYMVTPGEITNSIVEYGSSTGGAGDQTNSFTSLGKWCTNVMPFDWSPCFYDLLNVSPVATVKEAGSVASFRSALMAEFDNYIVTNEIELKKLHQVAVFSLLDVPTV